MQCHWPDNWDGYQVTNKVMCIAWICWRSHIWVRTGTILQHFITVFRTAHDLKIMNWLFLELSLNVCRPELTMGKWNNGKWNHGSRGPLYCRTRPGSGNCPVEISKNLKVSADGSSEQCWKPWLQEQERWDHWNLEEKVFPLAVSLQCPLPAKPNVRLGGKGDILYRVQLQYHRAWASRVGWRPRGNLCL